MNSFGWAIIGPGAIAHRFADAVQRTDGMHVALVCGRNADKALQFAQHWQKEHRPHIEHTTELAAAFGSAKVDGVYVATPHPQHFDATLACLNARKPVLCEKPLVPTSTMAKQLIDAAKQNNTFLMEAVWTRYLPIYAVVHDWLQQGAIGPLKAIQSSFCFNVPYDETTAQSRLYNPALAGGSLLDIGIYNITMSRWGVAAATGHSKLKHFQIEGIRAPSGVDQRVHAQLVFDQGITAQFSCGFDGHADNSIRFLGQHGYIDVATPFWESTTATLHRPKQPPHVEHRPFAVNGFEYEAVEAVKCIRAGAIESATMPHAETIVQLELMDEMRAVLGVRYPFE
jgi:predicted dehydrogenase